MGTLGSRVTGSLQQQLAFLSWCFSSSFECRGVGEALILVFYFLALEKRKTTSGKEFPHPVPLNLILRSESGKEQRLIEMLGKPVEGGCTPC